MVNNCCPFCRHAPLFPDLSGAEQKEMRTRAADLATPADLVWSSDDDDDQTDLFASMPLMSFSECVRCGELTLGMHCPRCTFMADDMLLQPIVVAHNMFNCTGCNRVVVAVPGETCLICAVRAGSETLPFSPWREGRWNL